MIFGGLDIAGGAGLLTLVGFLSCTPQPAPVVSIELHQSPPTVTHSLDHEALGKFAVSTTFSHASNEVFVTGGITESRIDSGFEANFKIFKNSLTNNVCISFDTIKVNVTYEPIVHIARNYPQGSCRFQQTWLHELRHVNTDMITINEFLPKMKAAAETVATKIKTVGPIDDSKQEETRAQMAASIQSALEQAADTMNQVRMQRQQLIDTRQEYLRLSKACPNER